jgi:hypothetical protein
VGVLQNVTQGFIFQRSYAVAVERTIQIDSPRRRRGRRRLRIAKNGDKVLNLCDFRRLKQSGESRKRLQGLNYPLDHLVGPDESSEGFGFLPPQENMDWLKRMMEEEGEE